MSHEPALPGFVERFSRKESGHPESGPLLARDGEDVSILVGADRERGLVEFTIEAVDHFVTVAFPPEQGLDIADSIRELAAELMADRKNPS